METDSKSQNQHNVDETSLKKNIHSHLLNLGFSRNGKGYFLDGDLTKQKIRNLHSAQRMAVLEQRRPFVEIHGAELAEHFASGDQIDPESIEPRSWKTILDT